MPLELTITYVLPESEAAERFAKRFESAVAAAPTGHPVALMTITDPELWQQWKQVGSERPTISISGLTPASVPVDDHLAADVRELLVFRGKSVLLPADNVHPVSQLLSLGSRGMLRTALFLMTKRLNYRLRNPDSRLQNVTDNERTHVNLTRLHFYIQKPYFKWAYQRYYRATRAKLQLVLELDRKLTELGIFDFKEKK